MSALILAPAVMAKSHARISVSRCKPLSAERQALIAARYEASNAFGILAYLAASACWTLALPAPGESHAMKGGAL